MHRVLSELGGFPKDQIKLLLDADADQVWQAIYAIEAMIAETKKDTGQKTLFVFYYSGHADGNALELGTSILRFENLLEYLKSAKADVRLAFLDSCKSGRLVSMKDSSREAKTDVRVTDEIRSNGYAIITSSAFNELSQESQEVRGAYFTHYLVSALRGAGDTSKDGAVTLTEAYQYAYRRTLARTSTTMGGAQHPMYEFELEGRGDIVLTRSSAIEDTGLAVSLPESGRFVVLDALGAEMVMELDLAADETAFVPLAKGTYVTYLMTPDNAVRRAEPVISDQGTTALGINDFETVALEETVARGGLFNTELAMEKTVHAIAPRPWRHELSTGGQWRLAPVEGYPSAWGAVLGYRWHVLTDWYVSAQLNWSGQPASGEFAGHQALGGLVGGGYAWPLTHLELRMELLGGYEHLLQGEFNGASRHTSGVNYLGLVGLTVPAGPVVLGCNAGVGGRIFQVLEKGWVHRPDVQVFLGVGYQWPG